MKTNDYIYATYKGDTFPGRVLAIRKRVKVVIDYFTGELVVWLERRNVCPQN